MFRKIHWGMQLNFKILVTSLFLIATITVHAQELFEVGGKIIDRHTKKYITIACETNDSFENCKTFVFAEGSLVESKPLKTILPGARFQIQQMDAIKEGVKNYIRTKAYWKFTWFPLTESAMVDLDEVPTQDQFKALGSNTLIAVTMPAVDVVLWPLTIPDECATIAWEHVSFPFQSKRLARLTGKLVDKNFSRKITDGRYVRLKKALKDHFRSISGNAAQTSELSDFQI